MRLNWNWAEEGPDFNEPILRVILFLPSQIFAYYDQILQFGNWFLLLFLGGRLYQAIYQVVYWWSKVTQSNVKSLLGNYSIFSKINYFKRQIGTVGFVEFYIENHMDQIQRKPFWIINLNQWNNIRQYSTHQSLDKRKEYSDGNRTKKGNRNEMQLNFLCEIFQEKKIVFNPIPTQT